MRNVDTVKELTDILTLDEGRLVDQSSRAGHVVETGALDDELILNLGGSDDATLKHINAADNLLTDKVADLNGLSTIGDIGVDGEVCVDHAKLVLVLLSQTSEHVVDLRADGTDGSTGLGVTEPHFTLDLATEVDGLEIDRHVLEVLGKRTVLASDGHNSGLDLNLDVSGDANKLFSNHLLH